MSRNVPGLTLSFLAGVAIPQYRILKFGADDQHLVLAAAVTDALFGVSGFVGADAVEDTIDVILGGVAEVEYGGTVTRGDLITSDASGRAVTAAPAAGVNNRIIGTAVCSGVIGDIGSVNLSQGSTQG